jgi:2-dehydro-3-deoxy-L-rhamnonate dehydrogenase (NAD+)
MNQLDLNGRRVVVTGGASGIGYAICQRIVASGGQPIIWDRNLQLAQASAVQLGGGALAIGVDVVDQASVQSAVAASIAGGRVDGLVNSAGITGPNMKVWDYPLDAWQQVININLNGLFLCCRELVPHMRANNAGHIVNIASVAGKEGNPNASAYSASKAGVIALTKSLGKELADTGVRVNCVTPAAVKTDMFSQMTQQHIDFMLSKIPMARFGQVEEIAAMVCWLLTDDCSFSTAATFDLSGGRATY